MIGQYWNIDLSIYRRVACPNVGGVPIKAVRYDWLDDGIKGKKIVKVGGRAAGGSVDIAGIRKGIRQLARVVTTPVRLELLGLKNKGVVVGGKSIHRGFWVFEGFEGCWKGFFPRRSMPAQCRGWAFMFEEVGVGKSVSFVCLALVATRNLCSVTESARLKMNKALIARCWLSPSNPLRHQSSGSKRISNQWKGTLYDIWQTGIVFSGI